MNAINQKIKSISIFNFVLPLFVLLFVQVAANAQSYTAEEQNCFNMVQGKVAYDKAGNRTWNESNIRNLCQGTTNAAQTINCFSSKISAGVDWSVASPACSPTALKSTSPRMEGDWTMYNDKGAKLDKLAKIAQSGANFSINNGYGANSTGVLNGNTLTTSDGLTGTVSADGTRINWNIGFVWVKQGSTANNLPNRIESETQLTPEPLKDATNKDSADSGTITRTITLKNNSVMQIRARLWRLDSKNSLSQAAKIKGDVEGWVNLGITEAFGNNVSIPNDDLVEVEILTGNLFTNFTIFRAILPPNKNYTTFCYEVSGNLYAPSVKTCDGSPTYESKYISFKNEAGYNSIMSLTYFPIGSSTAKTAQTLSTTPGYQTKLYLPLESDTDKPMKLKVTGGNDTLKEETVTLNAFDTTCYKVWGSIFSKKISPCSANTSARTIKLKNNGAYQAKMTVTYEDNGTSKSVISNPLEVLESDTVEVPNTSSNNPIKIRFLAYNKEFNSTTVAANFTGELCYKLEGTAFAPTAATCDDTVGDTTGETRQIRFQNDAGYDAQMIVMYFEDQIINGTTVPMAKTLSTGMINGLGGKFRLVSIPKNTSKSQAITIILQGNATVKGNNAIFSTTLPADFAASPQPCFKVWGTALNPDGGKCNQ